MRLFFVCMLLAVLALPLAAADISGKWTGKAEFKTPDGGTDGGAAFAEFKQGGQNITGGVGQSEMEQFAIENGKLVDNKLTFQLSRSEASGKRVFKFNLVVVNADHIEGDIEGSADDGTKVAGKLTLDRKTS